MELLSYDCLMAAGAKGSTSASLERVSTTQVKRGYILLTLWKGGVDMGVALIAGLLLLGVGYWARRTGVHPIMEPLWKEATEAAKGERHLEEHMRGGVAHSLSWITVVCMFVCGF
jgi:hypothetical protein